jgi:hypothetical protein
MRESKVHQALVARVKLLGGEVRRVKWQGRSNAPDVLVLLPAIYPGSGRMPRPGRAPFVEEKRPGKDAEDAQQREHERMRAAGCEVLVISTLAQIDTHFPLN